MSGRYDYAQICLSGHLITSYAGSYSVHRETFCTKCGEATTMECQHCNQNIRGSYLSDFSFGTDNFPVPMYCHNCGKPYPWVEKAIQEFAEIIDMADELDDVERAILKEKFPLLLVESPGTSSAALRISKTLKSATNTTIQALKSAIASKIAGHALDVLGWK